MIEPEWRLLMLTYPMEEAKNESMYEYLYRRMKEDILNHTLKQGEKLPSKRNFAKNLKVSVITIENAYAQLLVEGYIYAIERKGYFVADISEQILSVDKVPPNREWSIEKQEPLFADFSSNRICSEQFPFSIWTRLQREVMSTISSGEILTASPVGGDWQLRKAIAKHLYQFRGMSVEPGQIIIGAGTEYLYHLLIQLLGRNLIYAVEEPGYTKITKVYESNGVVCAHIPFDKDGVSIEILERSGGDILHISPSHHFPTGRVTPISRRYELLSWASKKTSRYIIEDEYDCEFRLNTKPIPTLQGIDAMEKVIYMNTFSKSLAPSIRISYMVLPKHLLKQYMEQLGFYSCTVSNFEQYTLAAFIERGYFEKHINRMRNYYRGKRDRILKVFHASKMADAITIREEDAGLHFLIAVNTTLSDGEVEKLAREKGIGITSLSRYYAKPESAPQHIFVINYSGVEEERMEEAVKRLIDVLAN